VLFRSLLVVALTLPAITASPSAKPEEVGLSSERLARITQMIERRIAAGDMAGAVEAFAAGTADAFFWEKFMTKPLVDSGTFRRIGEFAAPWSAFVACVADAASPEQRVALGTALALVLDEARALRARPDAASVIAARHGLEAADVVEWLAATRWSEHVRVVPRDLTAACAELDSLGVLARTVTAPECIARG